MLILIRTTYTLILSIILCGCLTSSGQAPKLIGQKIPPAHVKVLDQGYRRIDTPTDRSRVILYWATYCNVSRGLIQELNDYALKRSQAGDVEFIAVSLDRAEDEIAHRASIQAHELDGFTHAFSGFSGKDRTYLTLSGGSIPHILVIDPSGTLIAEGHSEKVVYKNFGEPDPVS